MRHSLASTHHRLHIINQAIDLRFQDVLHFHQVRYDDFMDVSDPPTPPVYDVDESLHFFDAMESDGQLEPLSSEHFFESYSSSSEMEGECTVFNFYDVPSSPPPPSPLLLFDDICDLPQIINCAMESQADPLPSLDTCPSPLAYNAALLGQVDLIPRNSPASFKVIFNSGASLAISPSKDDFVGEIKRFPQERRLGGMAQGMLIEGIGVVHWSFKSGNTHLIIKTKCYYVPDSKARLISPQRLFN